MKKYTITSKPGMPPFCTATTHAAAKADSWEARQLGLDGEIIEEPAQKSYQQIAGDGTTDRGTGGDTAPASPGHTPEPWKTDTRPDLSMEIQTKAGVPVAVMSWKEHTMHDNAERIVAAVNACAGMTDPEAEIKALRDACKAALVYCLDDERYSETRTLQATLEEALKGATK